ncbi:MAG TPA: hypothetical protein VF937_07790 [Chloroflexota bacterium]
MSIVRAPLLIVLALWLGLSGTALADGSSDTPGGSDAQDATPADTQPPSGPLLQPADNAPTICDPNAAGFRYLEVRGTGFDAWATQHLVGNVVDASGAAQIQWANVWVSPEGRLTLEVNLCADPFQQRPALAAGDYTVSVGQSAGSPIAAASISLSPPAEAAEGSDAAGLQSPDVGTVPGTTVGRPTPTAPPSSLVVPNVQAQPTPTPLPIASLPSPTPTAGPRTGLGSSRQPYPPGTPGNLVDGWQLVVTGVTPDAYAGIHADVPSAVAPAADQSDFMIRAQATYLGPGSGVFSGVRLSLLSGTQTTYDQIHNSCGVIPDSLPPIVATSGTTVRGNVCFTVRASDIGSLVLFDNQSSVADQLFFALQ